MIQDGVKRAARPLLDRNGRGWRLIIETEIVEVHVAPSSGVLIHQANGDAFPDMLAQVDCDATHLLLIGTRSFGDDL